MLLEDVAMLGPGRYEPDITQGITRTEDVPKPTVVRKSRSYKRRSCPVCGHRACRLRSVERTLHDLGDSGRPSGKKARAAARKNKRLQQKIKYLFDHRHLFVKRTLTDKENRILQRIMRGFPSNPRAPQPANRGGHVPRHQSRQSQADDPQLTP
jgi:hypothetical protein